MPGKKGASAETPGMKLMRASMQRAGLVRTCTTRK